MFSNTFLGFQWPGLTLAEGYAHRGREASVAGRAHVQLGDPSVLQDEPPEGLEVSPLVGVIPRVEGEPSILHPVDG